MMPPPPTPRIEQLRLPACASVVALAVALGAGCGGGGSGDDSTSTSKARPQAAIRQAGPTTPDVRGLDAARAGKRLRSAGLRLTGSTAGAGCIVVAQTPAPRAPAGSARAVEVEVDCGSASRAKGQVSAATYRVDPGVWATYDREIRLAAARVFISLNPRDCGKADPEKLVAYVEGQIGTAKQPVNRLMQAGCPKSR
jgi:hypothetical protein